MPKTVLDHYSYGKALADLASTRKELEALRGKVQAIRDSDCGAWLGTSQRAFEKRTELLRLLDALYETGLRAAVEKGK